MPIFTWESKGALLNFQCFYPETEVFGVLLITSEELRFPGPNKHIRFPRSFIVLRNLIDSEMLHGVLEDFNSITVFWDHLSTINHKS